MSQRYATYGIAVLAVLVGVSLFLALDAEVDDPFDFAALFFAAVVAALVIGLWRNRTRELSRQREKFEVTLASIGDGVIVTDTEARVTFLNEIAEQLTGWMLPEARGKLLDEVFPIRNEATGEPSVSPVSRVLEEGAIVGLANHTVLTARDGSERAIDDSAAPIRHRGGRISGVVLVFRDVTEKRQLESARERLAAVVESSEDAIIGQSLDGTITAWNRGAEQLFGYTAEEVIGRPIFETIAPADEAEEHLRILARVGRGERIEHFVTDRLTKDDRQLPVSIRLSPIRDETGDIAGVSAIDRDISEQVQADQRRSARLAVTQILADSVDLAVAVPRILRAVCEALEWDMGAFWRLHPDDGILRCESLWAAPERDGDAFQAATQAREFGPGASLPGRVRESGRALWVADVVEDPDFLRASEARDADLHGAFACPISVGDDFLGVLEFFSREIQPPDEDLLELAGTLGGQIGQFIERRRAEAELRRSERELADFFDNATMGLHWVGADGTILRANRCELELLGYEEEEYVGHNIADFHADDEVIDDILERLAAGETLDSYPARMLCKDGSIRHVLINSNVMWRDDEFGHTRCFTRDVTEEMRLREELQERVEELVEAEGRVRSVVDHVVDGIVTIDASGTVESFNPAAEEIFGYEADEVIGNNVKMLMPSPYREEHDDYLDNYHRTGEAQIIGIGREVVGLCKDGTEFPMDLAVSEFRHHGRRFYTGIVRDITERKRMEDALLFLAEASRTLSSLHDPRSTLQKIARLAVPVFADWCTVHVLGEGGAVESLAAAHVERDRLAAVRELGFEMPPHRDNGHGYLRVLRTGTPQLIEEITPTELRSLVDSERQLEILTELRPSSYLSVPLEADGHIFGALTFVYAESGGRYGAEDLEMAQDLARRAGIAIENARLYEQLQAADRRKDEFLAMLSHELRNPLAPIRTGLEILSLQHGEDPTIESMHTQVALLVRLVDDLLDVSRIMRGRVELREEMVDLAELTRQAIETVRPLVDQREQEIAVSMPEETISLYADPVRIVQVLENLLSNASKYSERRGRIDLMVRRRAGEVEIGVRDTGAGIEPELLPRIFEPFIQSPRSLERAQGGLGIGLTLVRQLVTFHGGTVTAHSSGAGEGSEFVVRLPVREKADTVGARVSEERGVRHRRILVVDDNEDAAEMLASLLQTLGHDDVAVAYDGPSALQKIREIDPEVVLLDIGLPGMDGHEVSRRMREDPRFDGTLLVAVTGYGQEEDRRASREAGFDLHLVKPVAADEIESALTHPKLAR